ncbi:MAG: hypothetical protein QOF58_4699 [Pseudonocardiales bacterium]|nr:hypothetical protein [Pseudonocardiales bacterium]
MIARLLGATIALLALSAATAHADAQWIAAWGSTLTGSADPGPANATVRNILRVSAGGQRIRIRVANPGESGPLVIGAASVAQPVEGVGPGIVPGTSRPITFGGQPGVTLPPKTQAIYSDPVDLPVAAQQHLAVSLHLPAQTEPPAYAATWNASYVSADGSGDLTRQDGGDGFGMLPTSATGSMDGLPLNCAGCTTYALTAVDVLTTEADGAVVGLGSSTFHGYNSTPGGWNAILDLLAVRNTKEIPAGQRKAIVNAGIGGDTLHAGLDRIERDVYSQSGVAAVALYDVNDLGSRTAVEIIEDYRIVITQAHARGDRVYCPTWPPAAQSAPSTIRNNERRKLNTWILNSGECDDIVDWDAVLRGAVVQDEYDPQYYSDGIHPNAAGHAAMAAATPLRWFNTAPKPTTFASDLGLPSTGKCVSRRVFRIFLANPRGTRLRSARVYVGRKRVRVLRGARQLRAAIDLRGLPRGTVKVRIVGRGRNGRTYVRTRTYRTCAPK